MIYEDEVLYEGNKITIISQNLFNYPSKNKWGTNQDKIYLNSYKADIYAFQEYPDWRKGKKFYTTFYTTNHEYEESIDEVEKLWKEFFPWRDFPKGYWSELVIRFNNVRIRIINIHITVGKYCDQLRLVLLKRLEQLSNEQVILAGDFNAAFSYQTESVIRENDRFLSRIIDMGYKEMMGESEEENLPHYTYALQNDKTKSWKRKKLDHIFVPVGMEEAFNWKLRLEYIDDVNLNLSAINEKEPLNPFTDHSGLKLVIETKICNF